MFGGGLSAIRYLLLFFFIFCIVSSKGIWKQHKIFPGNSSKYFTETTWQRKVRKKKAKEKQFSLLVFLKYAF
jgi:hypothetical protein